MRHRDILKADHPLALLAVEVHVHVIVSAMVVVAVAGLIFDHTAPILHAVYQVPVGELSEDSEYTRLLKRIDLLLQFA